MKISVAYGVSYNARQPLLAFLAKHVCSVNNSVKTAAYMRYVAKMSIIVA